MPQSKRKSPHSSRSAKPPATINCQFCSEAIIVPDRCQHGKKLANCRGTGCMTAHITNHNNSCPRQAVKTNIQATLTEQQAIVKESAVLSSLVKQELQNLERIRGKDFQYLKGIPKAEMMERINFMSPMDLRRLADELKSVGDGEASVDQAMYDDEDSDDDATVACPTPPPEDDESISSIEDRTNRHR